MVTRTRIAVLSLGCAALAGLGHAGVGAHRGRETAVEAATAASARSIEGRRSLGRFVLGTTRSGRLVAKVGIGPKRQKAPDTMELSGELRETPTDIEAQTVLVRTELRNARVTLASPGLDPVAGGGADAARRMASAFSRPFFARYAENGRLLELHFDKDLPDTISNTLGAVLAKKQFVFQPDRDAWVQRETDEGGAYLAAYTKRSDTEYRKKKLNYLEAPGSSPLGLQAQVETFDGQVEVDGSRWLRRLSLEEELELPIAPAQGLVLTSRLSLTLESVPVAAEPDRVGDFARRRSSLEHRLVALRGGERDEAGAVDAARRRLAGQSFESLAARLPRIAPRDERSRDDGRSELVDAFRDLYLTDKGALGQAVAELRSRPFEQASVLINAMGMLDTEAGTAALTRVFQDASLDDEKRGFAVRMIAVIRRVAPDTERVILELARGRSDRLGRQARLASGAVAYQVRAADPDRSLRLVEQLVEEFEAARDPQLREDWLMALGNAGHPSTFPTLLRVARGNEALAPRAIDALRRIDGGEVDGSLNEFLATAELRKRSAAIDAVGQREVGPFLERLVAILEHDPNEQLRSSAAQVLGRSVRRHPRLAQVLLQVAKTDSSKSVRRHASRFLETGAPSATGSSSADLVGG